MPATHTVKHLDKLMYRIRLYNVIFVITFCLPSFQKAWRMGFYDNKMERETDKIPLIMSV